ncbi:hypothetical protein GQ457_05G016220 [Hibiscus cannabinus]
MIVSKQNDLRELKEIWRGWNLSTKQTFQQQFGDIALLLEVQNDVHLFRALAQFWNTGYNCFTFGKVDMTPTIEECTLLLNCPKFKEGKVYIRPKETPMFLKNLSDITGMSAEWHQGKITEKGKSASISWVHIRTLINLFPDAPKKELLFALCIYGLKDGRRKILGMCTLARNLVQEPFLGFEVRLPNVPHHLLSHKSLLKEYQAEAMSEEQWIASFKDLQDDNVRWKISWLNLTHFIYRCDEHDWVPLAGVRGAIGYCPLLVSRQFGSMQFIPVTGGLNSSNLDYEGEGYKSKVQRLNRAWKHVYQVEVYQEDSPFTLAYDSWRHDRVNDVISSANQDGVRPMTEHMRDATSEIEKARRAHQKEMHVLEKRVADLEATDYLASVEDLKQDWVELQGNLRRQGYGKTAKELSIELAKSKKVADGYKRKYESNKGQVERKNKKLESLNQELTQRRSRNKKLTMQMTRLESAHRDSQSQIEEKMKMLEDMTRELTISRNQNQVLQDQNEEFESQIMQMEGLLQEYHSRDNVAALNLAQDENVILKARVTELESTLQDCRERLASFEGALQEDNRKIVFDLQQAGTLGLHRPSIQSGGAGTFGE